ncbi:lytic transglycosylase domain-containing protein [Streptomyces sp. A7024]|uniref:Lytic transglycosylase domain-containing protein n=1 Tax=Streptomyces coryli TaxID=1128680 RepID=A0A6G4TZP7_9ACTN|nr:lytic transglycosylase domain-containing protein [Streptomyces coryli]NGN65489.1 lytic transglycosylase domain-containing protein [Streptomyces coryli]
MTDNQEQPSRPFHTDLPPAGPPAGASDDPAQVPAVPAHVGIPATALAAYRHAEASLAVTYPGSRLGWELLAGMGMVASGHAWGGALDEGGTLASASASGEGVPGGRRIGPMGFDPSVWALWGIRAARDSLGGGGEGGESGAGADPLNIYDAALSAGLCLCAGGGDLRDEDDARAALEAFDAAEGYADAVIAWTESYAVEGTSTSAVVEAGALGLSWSGVPAGDGEPDEVEELVDGVSAVAWAEQLAEADYAVEAEPEPALEPAGEAEREHVLGWEPEPEGEPEAEREPALGWEPERVGEPVLEPEPERELVPELSREPDAAPSADRDTALLPAVLAEFVSPEEAASTAAAPVLDPHEQPKAERWVIRAAVGVVLAASAAFGVLAVQGPDGPESQHRDQADAGDGAQASSGAPPFGPTEPGSSAASEKAEKSSPDHDADKAESKKEPDSRDAAAGAGSDGDGARPQGGEDADAGGSAGGGDATGGGSSGSGGSGGTSGGDSGDDGTTGGSGTSGGSSTSGGGSSSGGDDGGGDPAPSPSQSRKLPGTDYYDWSIWVPGMR